MAEINQDITEKTIKELNKKTPWLHWGRLRFIGSIRVISVMSFLGAGIAAGFSLPQLAQKNINDILSQPPVIWSFFFFIISLLIANLIFHIYCPPIVKKFESLADFYMHQLQIKKNQMETYPDDPFDASLSHVSKEYIKNLSIKVCVRWTSLLLFIFSILCLMFFIFNVYQFALTNPISPSRNKSVIYFDFNKSELTIDAKKKLAEVAKRVKQYNGVVIIKGYTDSIGAVDFNQKLSVERATATRDYLAYYEGLNDLNIYIVGYGAVRPAAPNSCEEDRKRNRRVEIELILPNQ